MKVFAAVHVEKSVMKIRLWLWNGVRSENWLRQTKCRRNSIGIMIA